MVSMRYFMEPTLDLRPDASPQDTTRTLQAAIDKAGGNPVVIPPGTWTASTLELRRGATLRLARGAVLRAASDLSLYPRLPTGHNKDRQPFHFIFARGAEGITIEGDGTIDGDGPAHWLPPEPPSPWWRAKPARISPLIEIADCRDVVLRDFGIRNSPGWTVHVNRCDRVAIRGITLINSLYGPNTDGLDINGCRDVFVSDCLISCGDDAIILKATEDARSCERIAVTNCILESNCAALGLGAETWHGIRDVSMSNCVVKRALRMIQLEMWEPGTIENVVFSNISGNNMTDVPLERPIYIDIQQHGRPEPVLGSVRNVLIQNFAATTRGRIMLTAQDGSTIEDVTLRDVQLTYPQIEDPHITVPASRSTQMSNYSPLTRAARAAFVADNVRRLQVHNLATRWPDPDPSHPPMHGMFLRNVEQAIIDCPFLSASREGIQRIFQDNCRIEMRA